mgnify:CR=1 FL=1
MNIYEKLSAITNEISAVAKNLEVGYGQNKYKAVGEADVLAAVKPLEEKYKVYSYPATRELIDSGVIESTDKNGNVKRNLYMRIKTVYRFVDMEKPSDYIVIDSFADGVDTQDKAPGKAMTYAYKYALLKAYKIITGEDPDQKASEPLKGKEENIPMASEKQINYLKNLGAKDEANAAVIRSRVKSWGSLTMAEARALIEELK